jgi:hypothetical protein
MCFHGFKIMIIIIGDSPVSIRLTRIGSRLDYIQLGPDCTGITIKALTECIIIET